MPEEIKLDSRPASELSAEETATRAGVDISRVIGKPGAFTIADASPINMGDNEDIVSDTSKKRAELGQLDGDITKGLATYGINPPELDIDSILKDAGIADIEERRQQLEERKTEDVGLIEKGFGAAKEELAISQEEEIGKAEGRTRIGGFLVKSEIDDINKLRRLHRLEIVSLEGKRQESLRAARRAYEDQDYQLARDLVTDAKNAEQTIYQRKQDYFNNVIQMNNMQTPLTRLNAAVQSWAMTSMAKYPSGFENLSPEDLINITPAEITKRILRSAEYKKELKGDIEYSIQEVNGQKVRFGFDKQGNMVSKVNLGAADGGGAGLIIPAGATPTQNSLVDAFNNLSLRFTKDQASRATATFSKYLQAGNIESARQYLQSAILSAVPTEQYNRSLGRFEALGALGSIEQALIAFQAAGGKTGIITGSLEEIENKLGKTTDPKLAGIANMIRLAIVDYRRAVSGAAFTEAEGKEYERLFPSIGKGSELNTAKIDSLTNAFNRNNRVLIENVIGPGNYDPIFGTKKVVSVDSFLDSNLPALEEVSKPEEQKSGWSSFWNLFKI